MQEINWMAAKGKNPRWIDRLPKDRVGLTDYLAKAEAEQFVMDADTKSIDKEMYSRKFEIETLRRMLYG